MQGKKTMENENLREAVEYGHSKKWITRSNTAVRLARSQDWHDIRKARTLQDSGLVEEIQRHSGQLSSYDYRRIWALIRRSRALHDAPLLSGQRVYWVMRDHGLLLSRRRQPNAGTPLDGQVAVLRSNQRWCSDRFEVRCDNSSPLRVAFALDCCDTTSKSH